MDGATYTQTLVVHNDPRIGESATVMAALRTQNKLALAAYQGMKDADAGNDEVAAVRAQLAALAGGSLPPDVATAATALDAKLATFGGATGRGGRGGGGGGGGRGGGGGARAGRRHVVHRAQRHVQHRRRADAERHRHGAEQGADRHLGIRLQGVQRDGRGVESDAGRRSRRFNSLLTKNNQKALTVTPTGRSRRRRARSWLRPRRQVRAGEGSANFRRQSAASRSRPEARATRR